MTTVVGLFDNTREADKAVDDLMQLGLTKKDIGVMARKDVLKQGKEAGQDLGADAGVGATSGTVLGGVAGLLVGIGALAIPGLGPVIAAGTLGTVLGTTALGAGIGAATGGVVGALTGMGLSKDESHFYAEGVKRGGILVTANVAPERVDAVTNTLRQNNASDVNTRRQQWQQEGWQQFDDADASMTTEPPPPAASY
ncbi:MAG: hypothetical protein H0X24_08550 [Ktedonobacterales bacterium]|nr:hypothetical protein [Ktedonobacterales bacterium]